jgi:hypothetical protein
MIAKYTQIAYSSLGAAILLYAALLQGCGETIDENVGQTITEASLTSVTISPADAVISEGAEQQYTAIGRYSDNSERDITSEATWSTSDATVAVVTNTGLAKPATPLKAGTIELTATMKGIVGRAALSVLEGESPPVISVITVSPACSVLSDGAEQQLTALGRYPDNSEEDITSRVTWTSSDAAVATITDAGLVKASAPLKAGTAELTATLDGVSSHVVVYVTDIEPPQSIALTPADPSIPYGTSIQFTAEGTFTDGDKQDVTSMVTWLSSDATVTLKSEGLAKSTSHGAAVATITAAFACAESKATLTVRNADLLSIEIEPSPYSDMGIYGSKQFKAIGTFSDLSTWDITSDVVWNSSDTHVASIDAKGLATSPFPEGVPRYTTISASSTSPLDYAIGYSTLGVYIFD